MPACPAGRQFRWIACHEEFRDEYILVRELRAEDLGEEMIEIADDPCVWVEKIGADGRAVMVLESPGMSMSASVVWRNITVNPLAITSSFEMTNAI
jgi:hypothetical protein